MSPSAGRRTTIIALALGALIAVLAGGAHFGTQLLKARVERALGADAEVGEIRLGWNRVEVHRLRIKAPGGWPAADTLRAERILIAPDFLRLLVGRIDVSEIVVEGGYLSALRSPDGRLRVVPSLLERPAANARADEGGPRVEIGAIELRDGVLDFHDATVRKAPHRIRLEQLQARVTDLQLPGLAARSRLKLEGVVKGPRNDGRVGIDGWMAFSSRESVLHHTLQGVDLAALQPYLLKAAEAGVRKGMLDLDLQSTVRDGHLHAPGTLVLHGLELESGGTFMGLPRAALVGLVKDKADRIGIKFVLDGRLDDPHFRLNEGFATRIAASLGDALGVSLEGVVKGAGAVGQKGLEAAGGTAEGVGRAVQGLFR